MQRMLLTAVLALACSVGVFADVRTDEKTQVKLEGMLGRMASMFGGRAAREGTVSTVAVKGDRKATRTEANGQIIDLKEEKVYEVDYKDKSYTVVTFAQMRQKIEEERRKATERVAKEPDKPEPPRDGKEPQVDVDFSVKESGQMRNILGYDAHEVVMTIVVREKGKSLEQNGGMVLTNNLWLGPKIAALDEIAQFDLRYAQKLNLAAMFDAQQMAAAMAMYPMMAEAMKKMQTENVNLKGTPLLTITTFEAVANAEQAKQQQQSQSTSSAQEPPRGLSGLGSALGGRLGRRIAGGNKDDKDAAPAAATAPGRTPIMTANHEVLKLASEVSDADVAIPAGFKLKS